MLREQQTTMSGFSVDDPEAARAFYGGRPRPAVEVGGPRLPAAPGSPDGRDVLVYPARSHRPASYTVLNFHVPDIEAAVDDLTARGVVLREVRRHGDGHRRPRRVPQGRPADRWFADPSGNVLSLIEQPEG